MQKWKPFKDPPFYKKPSSFESGEEMMEWYRKAYRIPRIQRKIKSIGKNFVKDLRTRFGGTWRNTNIPSHIMKRGIVGPELKNYLLDQLEASFDEVEKAAKKRVSKPNLLRGALGKAAGILSVLIPTTIDPEGTSELPYPQTPFPQEDALIKQQQRQGMYGGGIVQSITSKRKVKRKIKKRNWNY